MGFRDFSFPFLGFNGFNDGTDDNCNRIGDIFVRKKGRNPILVGISAIEVLKNILELVQSRRRGNNFPLELSGLSIISIENEVLKFVTGKYNVGIVKLRFDGVGKMVEQSTGPGGVIHFGDLKALIGEDDACVAIVSFVVSKLESLQDMRHI